MIKILPRRNKTKKPAESKDPKAPVKPRRRRKVTRRQVVISLASVAGLLTAVAALIGAVRPIFPSEPKPGPSPNPPPVVVNVDPAPAPAPNRDPYTRRNRKIVTAEVTWPPGAPLRWGPNEKKNVKLNIPLGAKVKVQNGTCWNHDDVVSEMQGRWCQVTYKEDGKPPLKGWTFDAYIQREEEGQ